MTECDRCNRPMCYGCPYQEEEKTPAQIFEANLKVSSDHAIDMLATKYDGGAIYELIDIYYRRKDMQEWAINEIRKILKTAKW